MDVKVSLILTKSPNLAQCIVTLIVKFGPSESNNSSVISCKIMRNKGPKALVLLRFYNFYRGPIGLYSNYFWAPQRAPKVTTLLPLCFRPGRLGAAQGWRAYLHVGARHSGVYVVDPLILRARGAPSPL